MKLKITNTLMRKKQVFHTIDPLNVRVYVCGPTVYDYAHVGNARPAVVFDVLVRLLRHIYGEAHVTYVTNITDVDDKIINRSKELGITMEVLTREITNIYKADMDAIGVNKPNVQPRATEHIGAMIALTQRLINLRHAYITNNHVLFNVHSAANYGQLSRRYEQEFIAESRIDLVSFKRNPSDFVLWKPTANDQQGWDSPWGHGRPGWHIECSAMAANNLGEIFDIHGGGIDLIFPHHENEIAQSSCAFGHGTMANYWMHNGFVTVEGEVMSKSLRNFYTVHDLLSRWPGEAIRLLLLSAHYRQPLNFSKFGLYKAKIQLDKLYGAINRAQESGYTPQSSLVQDNNLVFSALCDDLNTPLALTALHQIARKLNIALTNKFCTWEISNLMYKLLNWGKLLGLLQSDVKVWFKGEYGKEDTEIEALIAARGAARKAHNFKEADKIRDKFKARGIKLEDGIGNTTWKKMK
ncbi:cysteine--tRNA ligase [Candidatus Endolissoclinum faulkneri]|nr:cysteine--tRNA ligase [Candidatus Endolissoclinum faulkneri]